MNARHVELMVLFLLPALIACMIITGCGKQPSTHEQPTGQVQTGIRISSAVTGEQIDFVNAHYDYVITSYLSSDVRQKVKGPILLLYRSIQSAWPGFNQFDWSHIDDKESMFCHRNGNRIKTVYGSFLMDGSDLVDKDSPSALNHWVNYYAATSAEQVHEFDYDGLFVDGASHKLSSGVVHRMMPDDYSETKWRESRYAALEFTKSHLPDKLVVFNGLHSSSRAEHSLSLTDGGMWETFAFEPYNNEYAGEKEWREVIELTERNKDEKLISIISKKENLTSDVQSRMFILASYLLVSNQNVVLYMSDLSYSKSSIFYYPEYEIELGAALGIYGENENGIHEREFERGIVLVNPSATDSITCNLGDEYREVVPVGGGPVKEDGSWEGSITYGDKTNTMTLPPTSGAVLLSR